LARALGGAAEPTRVRLSGTSCSAIPLTQYICQKCGSSNSFPLHLSQAISFPLSFVFGALRLLSIGFLDTFDLFDSSLAALPGNFLQLPLLSLVSALVCDLPLEKSAIA
jgi:hypothetical protein